MPEDVPTIGGGETSPTRHPPATPPGPAVPGYKILGELGRGAYGAVYKARHERLGRVVALKLLLAADAEGCRFQAEAETIASLHHPNIVQVYEMGEVAGRPYLALEFVAGGTLRQRLEEGPLPARPAARLVEVLARAVHVAHRRGVVHRDLKPANVLLAVQSEEAAEDEPLLSAGLAAVPKIADFGLAFRVEHDAAAPGQVVGTPAYMAPEQARGRGGLAGPAADVYALGAILYECLTGRPPFRAATLGDLLRAVAEEKPTPPWRIDRAVPADLEAICLRCLEKDPARRYRTAQALADDLQRYLAGDDVHARPAGPVRRAWRWCRRQPGPASWLLTVVGVLALAVPGIYFLANRLVEQSALESAKQQAALAENAWVRYAEAMGELEPLKPRFGKNFFIQDGKLARVDRGASEKDARPNVPYPATFAILLGTGQEDGSSWKIYSRHPFQKRPALDRFGEEALAHHEAGKPGDFYRVEPLPGKAERKGTFLRYAYPLTMKTDRCTGCHNDPAYYAAGFAPKQGGWGEDEFRGVLEVRRPMDADYRAMWWSLGLAFVALLAAGGGLLAFFRRLLVPAR